MSISEEIHRSKRSNFRAESSSMEMDADDFDCSSLIAKKIKQNEEMLTTSIGVSTNVAMSVDVIDPLKSSTSASNESVGHNGSNSDLSYQDDTHEDVEDYVDADDVVSDYDDGDDDECDYDDDNDDDYLKLQAQFDNVDLPPGVEASVPWLKNPNPSESNPSGASVSTVLFDGDITSIASSSKGSSSKVKKEEEMDDALRKLMYFKQFDTVAEISDHHCRATHQQPSKVWSKKIQDEWKILENNLPDTIYVRVCETRMDLLRAVIIGPPGTPYHDGLFVFDAMFPASYPNSPPVVHYYSHGLRLNPNLYDCGTVCLSLLNTWHGGRQEMWIPNKSTMLQVLVSIQALILNSKPFFNEPGYERSYRGAEGERRSKEYNESVFILSLKTMTYVLTRPPKHFEDLVAGHFRLYAHDILEACKAYTEGAEVGCDFKKRLREDTINGHNNGDNREGTNGQNSASAHFKSEVARMMRTLLMKFIENGSKDLEKFHVGV